MKRFVLSPRERFAGFVLLTTLVVGPLLAYEALGDGEEARRTGAEPRQFVPTDAGLHGSRTG
jgi:hypothetical protein